MKNMDIKTEGVRMNTDLKPRPSDRCSGKVKSAKFRIPKTDKEQEFNYESIF